MKRNQNENLYRKKNFQLEGKMNKKLDFYSKDFDPLLALYTKDIKVPNDKVRPLDNVAKCTFMITVPIEAQVQAEIEIRERNTRLEVEQRALQQQIQSQSNVTSTLPITFGALQTMASNATTTSTTTTPTTTTMVTTGTSIVGQKDLKRKQPMKNVTRNRRVQTPVTIETIMDTCTDYGPYSVLRNCYTKKCRVRVWIRRFKGIRGICVGFLIVFDKHINLVIIFHFVTFFPFKCLE